jgi:predicted nucleotidyltransferase
MVRHVNGGAFVDFIPFGAMRLAGGLVVSEPGMAVMIVIVAVVVGGR